MTQYTITLGIDFGEVGYRDDKYPFRVTLEATGISDLVSHVALGHRLYEFLLIDRLGDIWDYVFVKPEAVPPLLASRIERARLAAAPQYPSEPHPWPAGRIPFRDFDQLFFWSWDDTEPEDQAWLGHREASPMTAFAEQAMAAVRHAPRGAGYNDPLVEYEASSIRKRTHPWDLLSRQVAIERARKNPPREPAFSAAFYRKLDELLREPSLASVAYVGDGDYRALRQLCTEQRRRANATGHKPERALTLNACASFPVNAETWGAYVSFYSEGLGYGDLLIIEGKVPEHWKEVIESQHRMPPCLGILAIDGDLEIAGYRREADEGWVLYRRELPASRRECLLSAKYDRGEMTDGILQFSKGQDATLFPFDKTVILVGHAASGPVREALADVVARWESHGGDPLVIVQGDRAPFDARNCKSAIQPPEQAGEPRKHLGHRCLPRFLDERRPWIDAVLLINPPEDWQAEMAWVCERQTSPWRPWIVATADATQLKRDITLQGDLAAAINNAVERALKPWANGP